MSRIADNPQDPTQSNSQPESGEQFQSQGCFADHWKIVVFRMSREGVATSWMMLDMVERGNLPGGIHLRTHEPGDDTGRVAGQRGR